MNSYRINWEYAGGYEAARKHVIAAATVAAAVAELRRRHEDAGSALRGEVKVLAVEEVKT